MTRLAARPALLFLVVAGTALGAAAQRPVFDASIDLVKLTVSVLDDRGQLVTDLRAEDFVVLDEGRPQETPVFGRAHEPGQDELLALDVGLLFDTSQSMIKELKLSQEAAVRFLNSIPRARDLLTVFFDQDIRISRYDSENQQGLFERILAAKGGGNTALYDSIAVYLSRQRDTPGRKVLVILTDGDDSTSTLSLADVIDMLRGSSVTTYVVAFGQGLGYGSRRQMLAHAALQHFASLTGGVVFKPQGSKDLPEIYDKILEDLGGQYVLGFIPPPAARDGRYHRLRVMLKGRHRGWKLRHREGYYAPAPEDDGGVEVRAR